MTRLVISELTDQYQESTIPVILPLSGGPERANFYQKPPRRSGNYFNDLLPVSVSSGVRGEESKEQFCLLGFSRLLVSYTFFNLLNAKSKFCETKMPTAPISNCSKVPFNVKHLATGSPVPLRF